jgi:FAD/FMN-containing dehydrogenase
MKEEIQKIFKGEVDDSEETLKKYSHDASIFDVRPKFVLYPKDTDDVKNTVKWVNENKSKYPDLSITARCAGTDMSGGAINESIILDFTKYMNRLVLFNLPVNDSGAFAFGDEGQRTHDAINHLQEGGSITVQPGMFYRDFEKLTLAKDLILPCYTASKDLNAMGGMFGNNSAGERTLRYGKTEDYVMESKVVFEDGNEYVVKPLSKEELEKKIAQGDFEGNVYKNIYELIQKNKDDIAKAKPNVHKNSAGYYIWNVEGFDKGRAGDSEQSEEYFDLNKLIVGSQGTLGIATEITFRLVKPKPYTKLLVVFLRDISIVPDLVNKLLKYNPQTLESYDDKTFLLVLKYIRSFAKLLGLKNLFKLIFSFGPETMMTLKHGFPKLILLVEFTGDTLKEAEKTANDAMKELKSIKKIGLHMVKDDFEAKKYWTIRHEAFNLIRYHLKKMKSEPFVDDVIVRPERLPEFFPALYKILNQYGKEMTFAVGGHSGDGNMHIYTLLSPKDPKLGHIVMKVSEQVYDLVIRLGGSITAEHNDGITRTPFLEKMYGTKITGIFAEIKNIFDPKNIFNPGKKVPVAGGIGTKEYMASHITKSF